jgi:hypothetical protein
MLYLAYQAHSDFMVPVRTLAGLFGRNQRLDADGDK